MLRGMNNPIHFYFDFSSPYSYIANEWVDALAARHGRRVQRHAMLLGATFQAAELKSPVSLTTMVTTSPGWVNAPAQAE